ncbi:hypothetical protein GQR58_024932 [Nymphon striatum]|nr:hypothetical protein GQR58_024932 [Nymphon striatum]
MSMYMLQRRAVTSNPLSKSPQSDSTQPECVNNGIGGVCVKEDKCNYDGAAIGPSCNIGNSGKICCTCEGGPGGVGDSCLDGEEAGICQMPTDCADGAGIGTCADDCVCCVSCKADTGVRCGSNSTSMFGVCSCSCADGTEEISDSDCADGLSCCAPLGEVDSVCSDGDMSGFCKESGDCSGANQGSCPGHLVCCVNPCADPEIGSRCQGAEQGIYGLCTCGCPNTKTIEIANSTCPEGLHCCQPVGPKLPCTDFMGNFYRCKSNCAHLPGAVQGSCGNNKLCCPKPSSG